MRKGLGFFTGIMASGFLSLGAYHFAQSNPGFGAFWIFLGLINIFSTWLNFS